MIHLGPITIDALFLCRAGIAGFTVLFVAVVAAAAFGVPVGPSLLGGGM